MSILYQELGDRIEDVVASKLFLEINFGHSVLDKFNKNEHDNKSVRNSHLPIGEGDIDFPRLFNR